MILKNLVIDIGKAARLREVEVEGRTVSGRLMASDVPTSVAIAINEAASTIELTFDYRAARGEERRVVTVGPIRMSHGLHSRRLFSISIDIAKIPTKGDERAAQLARELAQALQRLAASIKVAGPKMNYMAVEEAIQVDDTASVPPAWLIDALKHNRPSHP